MRTLRMLLEEPLFLSLFPERFDALWCTVHPLQRPHDQDGNDVSKDLSDGEPASQDTDLFAWDGLSGRDHDESWSEETAHVPQQELARWAHDSHGGVDEAFRPALFFAWHLLDVFISIWRRLAWVLLREPVKEKDHGKEDNGAEHGTRKAKGSQVKQQVESTTDYQDEAAPDGYLNPGDEEVTT